MIKGYDHVSGSTRRLNILLANPVYLSGVIFLLVLSINAPFTFNPPYWDGLFGLHYQALWLADNNFNFIKLATAEPLCIDGGARAYMFSIPAAFYGILYKLFPPYVVFAIGHLMTYLSVAVIFTAVVSIIKKSTTLWTALLWCMSALFIPVFSARTAAIYQEMPLALFSLIAIYYVSEKRYNIALLWCIPAFMAKQTAMLIVLALLVWFVLKYLAGRFYDRKYSEDITWVPVALAAILLVCFISGISTTTDSAVPEGSHLHRLMFIMKRFGLHFYLFFPLLGIELIMMIVTTVCLAIAALRAGCMQKRIEPFSVFLLILTTGFWLSYSIIPIALPRYVVFCVFPMAAFLAMNLHRKVSVIAALVILLAGITNYNGLLLPALKPGVQRSGAYLERSREFLTDLEANQRICRTLENLHFNDPIAAQYFFVQMLTIPRMGYVSKALPNVYYPGNVPLHSSTKKLVSIEAMPDDTLYIYAPTNYLVYFVPQHGDTVMYVDESLPGKIYIFRKNQ